MDYEFHILHLERELAHLKELQALHRAHLEAHDKSLAGAEGVFERIEANLEKITAAQAKTDAQLAILAEKFNTLVELLTREHGNGRR